MNIAWDAQNYANNFAFVPQYGQAVLDLVDAPNGSFIVDLGCGNGSLTQELTDRGHRVLGIDASEEMLALAQQQHPSLDFKLGNALTFKLEQPADVVFSNAVFHWIDADKQLNMLKNIAANLKTGGKLVTEFGGKGCAEAVHGTLEKNFATKGLNYLRSFYFPTIGEYAPLLEEAGFKVEYALLFDRPTKQVGDDGLANWIRMFDTAPFEGLKTELKEELITKTVEDLRGTLYLDGCWYVDYVRIKIKAVKL